MNYIQELEEELIKFLEPKPERVYQQSVFFSLRTHCYYCTECDCIGASASRCPCCQSTALLNLARVLPRHSDSIHLEAV